MTHGLSGIKMIFLLKEMAYGQEARNRVSPSLCSAPYDIDHLATQEPSVVVDVDGKLTEIARRRKDTSRPKATSVSLAPGGLV